jgi:hypothetical protein
MEAVGQNKSGNPSDIVNQYRSERKRSRLGRGGKKRQLFPLQIG